MERSLHFHIRYVQPLHIQQLLDMLSFHKGPLSLKQIADIANEMEYEIGKLKSPDEQIRTLRRFGLISEQEVKLSILGEAFCQVYHNNHDLLFDLLHFFFYSTWNNSNPSDNIFSWTYRQICTYLWNNISCKIDVKNMASQLEIIITNHFPDESPSVGPDTIRAALVWLNSLKLGCLTESDNELTFTRRSFCPPELMIMAIDSIYREKGIPYSSNMLLNEENTDAICRACLIDKSSLDEVLSWSIRQFSFLQSSMMGGGWGQHLTLMRKPELSDLI